ncbi:LLM class flavin-dependent oxidoreductase [Conexibacter woesei]|uniref:LLM class flavin-dependent oxidoreductase n=1 Tax=Conexibacter woesei TaxID=191495 RepID=UPI000424EEC0|nr:LLM class flavin-dependent oxidoreductase [Conexibacter woesei]
MTRWGLNLPLPGLPLPAHRPIVEQLPDLGFDSVWTGEGGGQDAFTPLAAAAAWQPRLGLGTGVVPAATRGPAVLAQTAATLAELSSGPVLLGVGSSVPAHVEALNGVPFTRPLTHTKDTVRTLKRSLSGDGAPRVILGALRAQMLRFAYDEGDGAIVNLVFAQDLQEVLARADAPRPGKETIVKLFVCPTPDRDHARAHGRAFLGWLINQRPYHAFHAELPNAPRLAKSQQRFAQGDTLGARAALPDDVVDALWLSGHPEEIREQIARYLQPGVTRIVLYVAPTPELIRNPYALPDVLHAIRPEPARV